MHSCPVVLPVSARRLSVFLTLLCAAAFSGCQTIPASIPVTEERQTPAAHSPGEDERPCPDPLPLETPRDAVTDLADVLSVEERRGVQREIDDIEQARLAQVLVYIAPALPIGHTLEELTLCAANAWGVGDAAKDDGIAIFLFMADRKVRIELGFGTAEAISNEDAARVIEENMAPLFREGAFGEGLESALRELKRLLVISASGGATA